MARPSRSIDQALLASGRVLLPQLGCAGLTVRALAEHAGVPAGMFHYHFPSKDQFLRTLLAGVYEEMFTPLQEQAAVQGQALERLRAALRILARFARGQRTLIARLWSDAAAGQPAARDFFQQHAPRHVGVLMMLLAQGQASGALRPLPPLTALTFLMGAVALPSVFVAGLVDAGVALPGGKAAFEAQVTSEAALDARIELALGALCLPSPSSAPP